MYTLTNHLVVTHRDFQDAKEKWAEHTLRLFVILSVAGCLRHRVSFPPKGELRWAVCLR